MPLPDDAARYWLAADEWCPQIAAILLLGHDPREIGGCGVVTDDELEEIDDILHRIHDETASIDWLNSRPYPSPCEWLDLASQSGIPIPPILEAMGSKADKRKTAIIQNESGVTVTLPHMNTPPSLPLDPLPRASNTANMVAWRAVMLESWPAIIAECCPLPNARDALRWLKRNGPRDKIPEDQPDRDALHWLDSSGNPQTVALKTLSNCLRDWRKAGTIPPK